MKLTLNHTQRLNLCALIGAQRNAPVEDLRLYWRLLDRLELSSDERKDINFRLVKLDGTEQQVPQWDIKPDTPLREFDFSTDEFERLSKVVKDWQGGYGVSDRFWLEPVLAQIELNGQPAIVPSGVN
ncbi:MAG TPA: hypothetical protein VH157_06960 [Bryobacteraceae bacterium]|jgi:hypothetical protein|nr:hypothetical protein [Bryobacteraceae bacterium]